MRVMLQIRPWWPRERVQGWGWGHGAPAPSSVHSLAPRGLCGHGQGCEPMAGPGSSAGTPIPIPLPTPDPSKPGQGGWGHHRWLRGARGFGERVRGVTAVPGVWGCTSPCPSPAPVPTELGGPDPSPLSVVAMRPGPHRSQGWAGVWTPFHGQGRVCGSPRDPWLCPGVCDHGQATPGCLHRDRGIPLGCATGAELWAAGWHSGCPVTGVP